MEAQTSHEKSRLQAIEKKVKDVQEKLSTRLPTQYRHLVAIVCGTKWRLQTLKLQDTAIIVKKTRLELGSFDYHVKEQAELLTRYLLELDGVLSYGNADIKSARKALVVFIQQQLLPQADAFKERSAKLKQFGEDALGSFETETLESPRPSTSDAESDDMHVKALFDESEEESGESEEEGEEFGGDKKMENSSDVNGDEHMESETEADDESEDEEEEQGAPLRKSPRLSSAAAPQNLNMDVNRLPVWRPYYQLQRRQDGIYLIARLNDVDPRNVRVKWNNHNGMLCVSGFRLPTQKDIVMSRLSGAPAFGRFEIAEQFPRHLLNMEEATQQMLENGTLQIRMPYYVTQRPLQYFPASLFQPKDCFVW